MYEFGPFQMDPQEQVLWRDGKVIPLSPKLFDTLLVLVQNSGHLVDKDEMLRRVWPDSFVEEGNLTKNVFLLRKILEDGQETAYIETVPKRGYRFVASVKTPQGNGSGSVVAESPARDSEVNDLEGLKSVPENDFGKKPALSLRRPHWLVVGGVVALCVGIVAYLLVQRQATARGPQIKSIAVLPLQNLSGDPAQEYFADGMTEALISGLAQIRSLKIISRTSAMSFKGTRKPLPEIARELRVDAVTQGSVQRENGRVKVMIQLIHGPTDTHLWVRNYERALTDILKLQDEMARAIADEIHIQVAPENRARRSPIPTVNPAAHEAYLLGRFHFWKFIIDDHRRAIKHFERAIQLDPGYAPAYAGLSLAWQLLGLQGGVKGVDTQARAAAQRALELDDRLAEAYVARGHLELFHDWDWKGAENSIRRALELDPNNLDAHFYYALVHLGVGRLPEAIAEIQTAEQLDPLSHQVQANFGRILLHAGKLDEALQRVKQAIEREPRSANAHVRLAEVYEAMGRYTEALEIYDKARVLRGSPPDNPTFRASVAKVDARMGKRSEARRIFEGLKDLGRADIRAGAYAAIGDKDEAFRLLFKMVEKREGGNPFIGTDPQFASLHSDPRWQELRRRMGLPDK
ncbi:MAG: tetratricopeptide repeat protein [Acidobacteria bacterium]|nr:tetratricopeptide repeat protein [Acidobacteriota bacterium]MCI0625522.1 tetratricopeptide repeat protein [Acidobacteriota bacterium]MCI0719506.1 tetratricopeptide repeat protein [Acidobacteriota bacterium]